MKKRQKIFLLLILSAVAVIIFDKAQGVEKTMPEASLRPKVVFAEGNSKNLFKNFLIEQRKQKESAINTSANTQQKEEGSVSLPPLAVQGMMWGGDLPMVIINKKVLKIGDTIEGAQIVNIDKTGVKILYKKQTFNLNSPSGSLITRESNK